MNPALQPIMDIDGYLIVQISNEACLPINGVRKYIGNFSITEERFYCDNAGQLKYFNIPGPNAFPIDITEGLNKAHKSVPFKWNLLYHEYLNHMLSFISHHPEKVCKKLAHGEGLKVMADFICSSNLLQDFMCTPYNLNKSWKFLAIKYRNSIYMCLGEPDVDQPDMLKITHSKMEANLGQYVYTTESSLDVLYSMLNLGSQEGAQGAEGGGGRPAKEFEDFKYVYQCTVGDYKILYSTPMGGVYGKNKQIRKPVNYSNLKFIDCKLNLPSCYQDPMQLPENQSFEPKQALKWCVEGFLSGTENVYVGSGKTYGKVEKLRMCNLDILCQENKHNWSINVCWNFLAKLLRSIKTSMEDAEGHETIYEFHYLGRNHKLFFNKVANTDRHNFIADWYRSIIENCE